MSKAKEMFLKVLPMLIVLVSTGVFIFAIKLVVGFFYQPKDSVFEKHCGEEDFVVVQCYQNPSSHYYLYPAGYFFDEKNFQNAASEHDKAHLKDEPLAIFTLNETPLDMENTVVKTLFSGNGLVAYQFGEFVVYRLEGEYGVFAPLREFKQSATKRKNDLYVVRQLLKEERYKNFVLPSWEPEEDFLKNLEKIERHLDSEYAEDH